MRKCALHCLNCPTLPLKLYTHSPGRYLHHSAHMTIIPSAYALCQEAIGHHVHLTIINRTYHSLLAHILQNSSQIHNDCTTPPLQTLNRFFGSLSDLAFILVTHHSLRSPLLFARMCEENVAHQNAFRCFVHAVPSSHCLLSNIPHYFLLRPTQVHTQTLEANERKLSSCRWPKTTRKRRSLMKIAVRDARESAFDE